MLYLNKLQHRLWLDDAIHHTNLYNVAYTFLLEGELNINRLKESLFQLVTLNPVYRSTVIPDQQGLFYFKEKIPFVLPFEKIELPEDCREEDWETVIEYYARIPLNEDSDGLCKFYLFCLEEAKWCFLTKFHHSVMDGMSMHTFCNQLSDIYNGKSLLSIPVMQEYNQYLKQVDCHSEEDYLYWKEYLTGISLRTPVECFDGKESEYDGRYYFRLGENLFRQCDHFCLSAHTTQFRLLAAVWAATVGRFCSHESEWLVLDHTINLCPVDFRETLGNYVNNLPLKIKVADSLYDILARIRQDRQRAKAHQLLTYTELIPRLRSEKLLSVGDAINIGIDYPIINNRLGFNFHRCSSQFYRQPQMDLGVDLCLAVEKGSEFRCHIRYRKHIPLYYVKELAEAFRHLLIQGITSPHTPMDDFPLLTTERERIILETSSKMTAVPNKVQSVIERFQEAMRKYPRHTAIVCASQQMNYAELYEQMIGVTSQIYQAAVGMDDNAPIGVLMDRTPQSIAVLLGILASGHAYVPLDKMYPEKRIHFILRDCGVRLLVTDTLSMDFGEGIHVLNLDFSADNAKVEYVRNGENTAYIIYTSGTTGTPKGTPIRHYQLINLVDEQVRLFSISPDSRVLYFASMSFDASVSEIFTTLLSGACLVMATEAERHDPELLLGLMDREKVTCATIPPALLAVLPHQLLPHLKTLVIAGDKCTSRVLAFWCEGRTVINAYGPTENTVCATAGVIKDLHHLHNIGSPLRNVCCYVLDKRMRLLPYGVPGELYIGGLQLTDGYMNRPELNAEKFLLNPFSTEKEKQAAINTTLYKSGDCVRLLPGGDLEFIGRTDAQLKIRGMRVEPSEIEQTICRYPGISQVHITTKGEGVEKRLIAYIQPAPGAGIEISELKRYLSSFLPVYMVPSAWVSLKEFPRNVNGKIDALRLPEPDLQEKIISPVNMQEVCLSQIAAHILGVDQVSVESDLLELGFDSLSVMNLVVEAGKLNIQLTVASIYRNRTIREILKGSKNSNFFWYNEYGENKPVLVIICGYPQFYQVYYHLARELGRYYSLFVFDSYNNYFQEEWSCEDLIAYYTNSIADIFKDKPVYGISGFCLGGELALLLAARLDKEFSVRPKVWVMDGEAGRDPKQIVQIRFLYDPTVSLHENQKRDRMLRRLLSTFTQTTYPGEVYVALSKKPMTYLQFDRTRPESSEDLETACKMHTNRPVLWKTYYPDVLLTYIDTDHYHFLDENNIPLLIQFLTTGMGK